MHGHGRQHGRVPAGGRRQGQALRAAELAHHDPPAVRRRAGQATDIEIQAREILKLRERLNRIYAEHTGQTIEKIRADTDRDYFMSGEEPKAYGLIDKVLTEARSADAPTDAPRRKCGARATAQGTGPFSTAKAPFSFELSS